MKMFIKDKIYHILKNLFPKTFRSHILLSYLFLAFVPFLIISFFLYYSAKDTIKNTNDDVQEEIVKYVVRLHQDHLNKQALLIENQIEEAKNQVLLARSLAENIFSNKGQYPGNFPIKLINEPEGYQWENTSSDVSNIGISAIADTSPELIEHMAQSKYLEPLFKNIVTSNQHIAAMYYINSESAWRMFPSMDVKFEIQNDYLRPDTDLTLQPFYYDAVQTIGQKNGVLLTDTYKDLTHRDEVFTLSSPVYVHGENIGIIGADITTNQVMKYILNFKFKEKNAYAMLISKSLNFIAYQEDAVRDISAYHNNFRNELYTSNSPAIYNINGEEKIFLFAPINNAKWQLIYVIPKNDVLSSITDITENHIETNKDVFLSQVLSIVIVIILLLLFSSFMFLKYFTTPLKNLLSGISSISKGKLDTTIHVNYLEEFKQVAEAFNDMSNKINELLNDYKQLNSELEDKVEDRTEQLSLANKRLIETNNRLLQMESSRRELFSNVAHDLKTPITLVAGYVEAIRDGMIEDDKLDEYIDRILRHITSINRLAKDLYELSTVEMKAATFYFKTVDTYSYFYGILSNYQNISRIVKEIPKNLPPITIDKEYVKRAIYNLLENSVKYSKENLPILVSISNPSNNELHIAITDFGSGIPKDALPHIFERFYRADKSRNSNLPGSGLGLAIVKEIINAHNGKIEVASEVGKGSTFTIILPIEK